MKQLISRIQILVNPQDKKFLEEQAEKNKLSLASYCRHRLFINKLNGEPEKSS